jgi:hypothetical protein
VRILLTLPRREGWKLAASCVVSLVVASAASGAAALISTALGLPSGTPQAAVLRILLFLTPLGLIAALLWTRWLAPHTNKSQ